VRTTPAYTGVKTVQATKAHAWLPSLETEIGAQRPMRRGRASNSSSIRCRRAQTSVWLAAMAVLWLAVGQRLESVLKRPVGRSPAVSSSCAGLKKHRVRADQALRPGAPGGLPHPGPPPPQGGIFPPPPGGPHRPMAGGALSKHLDSLKWSDSGLRGMARPAGVGRQ